jgi:hypothetical protein
MKLKHLVGGLLLASVSAVALVSLPQPAQAGPPGPGHCPPGLAKKNPPCVPPGLAKKYYPGDIIYDWRRYDRIYYGDYDLRRPGPGHHYIRIGGDVYLIAEATQRVIEAINLFDAAAQ